MCHRHGADRCSTSVTEHGQWSPRPPCARLFLDSLIPSCASRLPPGSAPVCRHSVLHGGVRCGYMLPVVAEDASASVLFRKSAWPGPGGRSRHRPPQHFGWIITQSSGPCGLCRAGADSQTIFSSKVVFFFFSLWLPVKKNQKFSRSHLDTRKHIHFRWASDVC